MRAQRGQSGERLDRPGIIPWAGLRNRAANVERKQVKAELLAIRQCYSASCAIDRSREALDESKPPPFRQRLDIDPVSPVYS